MTPYTLSPYTRWLPRYCTSRYWLQQSDFYVFPHVQHFDSWAELLISLRDEASLMDISRRMAEFNAQQRRTIEEQWKGILNGAVRLAQERHDHLAALAAPQPSHICCTLKSPLQPGSGR